MYYEMWGKNNPKVADITNYATGTIRVLHAVPDAPNVDIYANDKLIAENLAFGESIPYIEVPVGNYIVSLFVTGTKDSPVISNKLTVGKDDIITVAAVGLLNDIEFMGIYDANVKISNGKVRVRFIHLSPNAPAVDITLPNGAVLFNNIAFGQVTPYVEVDEGEYDLQVRLAGTDTVVLELPDVELEGDQYYSVYAVGLVGQSPELEALFLNY